MKIQTRVQNSITGRTPMYGFLDLLAVREDDGWLRDDAGRKGCGHASVCSLGD